MKTREERVFLRSGIPVYAPEVLFLHFLIALVKFYVKRQRYEKLEDYYSPLRFRSAHYEEEREFTEEKAEGRMNGITAQQQKDILDLHNALRRKEGSSNMYKLVRILTIYAFINNIVD